MEEPKKAVCAECGSEREGKVFLPETYIAIDSSYDYDFPSRLLHKPVCVVCVSSYKTSKLPFRQNVLNVDLDWYFGDEDVHLLGQAYIIEFTEDTLSIAYESTYPVSSGDTEESVEVPIYFNVLVRGKTMMGKGSHRYKDLIETLLEEYREMKNKR